MYKTMEQMQLQTLGEMESKLQHEGEFNTFIHSDATKNKHVLFVSNEGIAFSI